MDERPGPGGPIFALRRAAWLLEVGAGQLLRRIRGRPPEAIGRTRLFTEPALAVPATRHEGGPLVSVVIPCFNYGRYLPEALASVQAQTFTDLEILVVDGGSTDGTTPAIVESLVEGEEADGRVRVFLREGRHLVGSNRNFGIERARGRYICCLDADDRLAPTYIEKAVFLAEHRGFDVVGSSARLVGAEEGAWNVGRRVDLRRLMRARNPVSTHALFRRDAWARIGGYRDHGSGSSQSYVYEDWEFWTRLAAAGARFHNMHRDRGLLYRIHEASLSRREGVRSRADHAGAIAALNAKELTPHAARRSSALRRTPLAIDKPLLNLVPDAAEAGRAADPRALMVLMNDMAVGDAQRRLSTVLEGLARRGWTLVVVTTRPRAPEADDAHAWFERATPRIYHLDEFLPDSARWPDYLAYLVAAYRIGRVLIPGSGYGHDHAAALKARHPGLVVLDLPFDGQGGDGQGKDGRRAGAGRA